MGCLSGCLMSSASIRKLFCGIYSAFKCSLDEFVGEKVVSPSYSSTILGPPPQMLFSNLYLFSPPLMIACLDIIFVCGCFPTTFTVCLPLLVILLIHSFPISSCGLIFPPREVSLAFVVKLVWWY